MSDMPERLKNKVAIARLINAEQDNDYESSLFIADAILDEVPPTREQIMADPRVMALVDSIAKSVDYFPTDVVECRGDKCRLPWCESCFGAADAYASLQNAHDDLDALHAALAALTDNEGDTE